MRVKILVNPLSVLVAVVALVISACGTLAAPKSLPQQVAYGNGALTAVLNATATSLDAHQISSNDAKAVKEMALKAAYFLDAATNATTEAEGQSNLALAQGILTQLQAYLNARSVKQ